MKFRAAKGRKRVQGLATGLVAMCAWTAVLAVASLGTPLLAQQETHSYLVRLREEAVIPHLLRQDPARPQWISVQSSEAARYRSYLFGRQATLRRQIERLLGAQVQAQMDTVFNGFAVLLRTEDVEKVRQLPEVAEVIASVRYRKALDAALPLTQVPAGWAHPRIGGEGNAGAGIKIGIIDTGIDVTHPMFQDPSLVAPGGYPRFTLPTLNCLNSDQRFTNSKVIVARNYVRLLAKQDPNCDAEDRDGHGTANAGISAGRPVAAPLASISGVAPKAFLGNYKVFGTPGTNDEATLGAIVQALDDAVKDGMDVLNLSLGAQIQAAPSQDPLALAVSAAVEAGVTVVVAAGNDGPGTGTIASPGTAPAVITVGASTNSRLLANPLIVSAPAPVPPELTLVAALPGNGPPIQVTVGPARLTDVTALDRVGNACAALPANSLSGQLAFIRRGECTFATKILNAFGAGAIAAIIYNNQFNQPPTRMDVGASTQIPSVMIGNAEGTILKQFLASAGAAARAALDGQRQAIPTPPNQMARFSSVGPSTDFGIKPDLVAPGTNLYSATERNFPAGEGYDPSGFNVSNGTSVSTPIVAGAAALVKQASPSFIPAQIKSVLVNTAARVLTPSPEGVSGVLAQGNGLLNVGAALQAPAAVVPPSLSFGANQPGFVLNNTTNVAITNLGPTADTFSLTAARSPGSAPVNLTASPATFLLGGGATTVVAVNAASLLPLSGTAEGTLELRSQNTQRAMTIPYWGSFVQPRVNAGGVINAASLVSGPSLLAPGSLISMFGSQLALSTMHAGAIPLPSSLGGVHVMMGDEEAPLLFISPGQINAQIPVELAGRASAPLQVFLNGLASPSVTVALSPAAPGIFTVNQAGTGRGAILHASSHAEVTANNPALPAEILEVYANGLGATIPPVGTGQAASSSPLAVAAVTPTATLGGIPAQVQFAGLAPSFVGLYQVNLQVPANVPAGEQTLILTSNGVTSNPVTVFVGR